MKLAAIDIGTNAARLLIANVEQYNGKILFQKLAYHRVPLRLGEEVFVKGKISAKKAFQFTQSIHAFQLLAQVHNVQKLRAVATSAMRDAQNAQAIVKEILKATGVQIEIISGDEEAQLIFSSFDLLGMQSQQQFVVVDVGGGSTEVSVFEHGEKVAARSFELGTLRILKEKHEPENWSNFTNWITENVQVNEAHIVFGTGGNINRALKLLTPHKKNILKLTQLEMLYSELAELTLEERCIKFRLKPDRADVILPALKIYILALKAMEQKEINVPKIGLVDGVIYQLFLLNSTN